VSCGLSATINATQPEELRISIKETFAHWLDTQWLRLSNKDSPDNPLTQLCTRREWKWVAVLDYILLRKIRSSFLLCNGINPGSLTTEVEDENLNWTVLKPIFIKILTRLNASEDNWPIWQYEGELKEPEKNMDQPQFRKDAKAIIQSIKAFYEIYQTNVASGPDAEWRRAIDSIVGFPEKVTPQAVVSHLDYYKTNVELTSLLQTLGYVYDSSNGNVCPKTVIPNSVILINRPEHWVTEDHKARGTVLDSLTQGTDAIHTMDSFYYFKPLDNLRILKTNLPKLAKIFPQIDIEVVEEEADEFPALELPATTNPAATAVEYHHAAAAALVAGDLKKALSDKRIEVAFLEKLPQLQHYYATLLEFTDMCVNAEKFVTAQENLTKLTEIEPKLDISQNPLKIKRNQLSARLYGLNGDMVNMVKSLEVALKFCEGTKDVELAYEIANSLGIANAKAKKREEAIRTFKEALKFATSASKIIKMPEGNAPRKYWPALLRAVNKRIQALEKEVPAKATTEAIKKIE
jgi:tetratricopeptide (TPR) repeat protein